MIKLSCIETIFLKELGMNFNLSILFKLIFHKLSNKLRLNIYSSNTSLYQAMKVVSACTIWNFHLTNSNSNVSIRLPSLRVRRRRLHQDTICGGQDGTQVQLKTCRTSERDLRISERAVQALGDSAPPHSTPDHTQEGSQNRKVGAELERK